ncbi:MAG TPA: DUF4169 family protein [Xanthobacteraceae bacterium]|nr:DUF4169 family protein [Xanthobacteraceae bacterium]
MADVVNLRLARKQAKRRQAEQDAAQRRLEHGRSKADTALQRAQTEKAERELDRHRRDGEDDS